jgi:hypothetical protein
MSRPAARVVRITIPVIEEAIPKKKRIIAMMMRSSKVRLGVISTSQEN